MSRRFDDCLSCPAKSRATVLKLPKAAFVACGSEPPTTELGDFHRTVAATVSRALLTTEVVDIGISGQKLNHKNLSYHIEHTCLKIVKLSEVWTRLSHFWRWDVNTPQIFFIFADISTDNDFTSLVAGSERGRWLQLLCQHKKIGPVDGNELQDRGVVCT